MDEKELLSKLLHNERLVHIPLIHVIAIYMTIIDELETFEDKASCIHISM